MLVVLINQQHLIPLTALELVNGQAVAEIKRTGEVILIVIIKTAALLNEDTPRYFDFNAFDYQGGSICRQARSSAQAHR